MESKYGFNIKIRKETRCLCCKKEKANLNWHKLTHDGVMVINYLCRCGEETVIYRKIKWV